MDTPKQFPAEQNHVWEVRIQKYRDSSWKPDGYFIDFIKILWNESLWNTARILASKSQLGLIMEEDNFFGLKTKRILVYMWEIVI